MLRVALGASPGYGRRSFDDLDIRGALPNVRIVPSHVGVFRDKVSQKIVRGETGVVLLEAHSAPFSVTQ